MTGLFLRALTLAAALTAEGAANGTDDGAAIATSAPGAGVPRRTPLSMAAAVVPGLILHGSGHFAGGDRRTAWRLLAVESVGLAATVAGFAGLALTGASRRLVGLFVATSVAGGSILLGSGLADLYGVLAPAGGLGSARPFVPWVEARTGLLYVRNPTFPYRWLGGSEVDFRWRRWRIGGGAWSTREASTLRMGGAASFRLYGPVPGGDGRTPAVDGEFADVSVTLTSHSENGEAAPFRITTGAVRVDGRVELGGFAGSLAGAFADWAGGISLAAHTYGGTADAIEVSDALIARAGFGFYLGRGLAPWAELLTYYDHAHDGFAGGLKMPGLGSGPLGHFGIQARIYLSQRWGVAVDLQAGSAHVIGLGVLHGREKS